LDIQDISDSLIKSGSIAEFIIVTPNANNRYGGSNYENNPVIGDYRTFVTSELVSLIDDRYRTLANRESRGIAGHSMGGQGALVLASDFPQIYGAVAVLSPAHNDLKPPPSSGLPGLLERFDAIGRGNPPTPFLWTDLQISDEDFRRLWGRSQAESRVAVNFVYAAAASFSPNPDNPPFYVNLPLGYSGGIPRLVRSVWSQWKATDLVSHIRKSRANLAHTAIYLSRGTFVAPDPNIRVRGEIADIASTLRALDEAGLVFEYETFPGDHFSHIRFQVEQALRFFTRKLRIE
jgi:pimeloyl-ACP methyl ester carboxylesterase